MECLLPWCILLARRRVCPLSACQYLSLFVFQYTSFYLYHLSCIIIICKYKGQISILASILIVQWQTEFQYLLLLKICMIFFYFYCLSFLWVMSPYPFTLYSRQFEDYSSWGLHNWENGCKKKHLGAADVDSGNYIFLIISN